MVVGFFELRLSGLTRFPLWISRALLNNTDDLELVYFYDQADCDLNDILSQLPENASLKKINTINSGEVIKLLEEQNLDRLVVMAQRIPDSCLVVAAKSLGISTIMYQHGLYIPFMKRQGSLFFTNLVKTFRFLQYAMATANMVSVSRAWLLIQYIRLFVLGHPFKEVEFPADAVNTDVVLVYGDYWKEYHTENFGYSAAQQYTVGAPDLSDISELQAADTVSNTVCYIAQTLVEDGRLPRSSMLSFIANLSQAVSQSGLHLSVRLHPRSDLSLYSELPIDTVLSKTDFPKNTVYIGHYSSILAKATFLSNNIILVDFPEHIIPDYIAMVGNVRLDYHDRSGLASELARVAKNGIEIEEVSKNIDKQDRYFDSRISNPLQAAALAIRQKA